MRLLLTSLTFVLTSCTTLSQSHEDQTANVTIHIVDKIPNLSQLRGLTICKGNTCEVWVQRKYYPDCLTHELRHVFEGRWHGTTPNTDYCR